MSDFLFSTRRLAPGELRRILELYLAPVTASFSEHHGSWGSLAVARAYHDAEPVREDERALSVVVGQPTAHGGADALHALLRAPAAARWESALDGPGAALCIEKERAGGVVVSDLASFVPMYVAEAATPGGASLVLSTHPDCAARAAARHELLDLASVADLAVNLTCTFPHTIYRGVEQFPPASVRRFAGPHGWEGAGETYWEPVERNAFSSQREAAEALREALVADVRAACVPHALAGLLLSGGEDARAVLGAVPPGSRVRAFVFADWENREVRIAAWLARIHGAELVFGRREPDHYFRGFEDVASMVGSNQLFSDVHGYGFHAALGIRELPVVLGGLSSDAFLKAVHAPAGAAAAPGWLPRAAGVRPDLLDEVRDRRTAFRARLAALRPQSAAEWERLWPFSMRKHAANFHGNRRLFASHEPFQCSAVVRVAASVPQAWKRRGALFHRAVRPLLAKAWYVPHSRYRFPFFGPYANLPLWLGLRAYRGVRAVVRGQVRARHGPWPKWRHMVRSPAAVEKQRRYPITGSPLHAIFLAGSEEAIRRVVRAEWHPLRELMLLQLAFLIDKARRA